MSKTYSPVPRHGFIGVNIRPGFTPGSFSQKFAQGRTRAIRPKGSITSTEVREAANRFLEKRHLLSDPNFQDGTSTGGFRRY